MVHDHFGMGSRVIAVAAPEGEKLLCMPANLEKYTVMKRVMWRRRSAKSNVILPYFAAFNLREI